MLRIVLIVFAALAYAKEDCDKLGILVYEDIGCKPVNKDGADCPIKYDCGNLVSTNETCVFKGRSLKTGDSVQEDEISASCNVGCTCTGVGRFQCAILDCAEWLGSPVQLGCYRKYDVDKCCSVGQNCPSETEKFDECTIEDKKYKEGEKFYPKDTCLRCVCPAKFNGKFEQPHCQKFQCAVQIRHGQKLKDRCAPFYSKSEVLCCPDEWVCPAEDVKIVTVNENAVKNSELTCEFGDKTLQLGEGFEREVDHYGTKKNAKCECILPPFLTCKEI